MAITLFQSKSPNSRHSTKTSKPDARWIDSQWGVWLVEIASGPSLRDVQGALTKLAVLLDQERSEAQGLCVVSSEKISLERLRTELTLMRTVFRPDLANRLHMGRCGLFGENVVLEPNLPAALGEVVKNIARNGANARRRSPRATQADVFAYLVRSWLAGTGPLMVKDVQEAVGASYPTVSAVLEQLKKRGVLDRLSDRRVTLTRFPRDEFQRWLLANLHARKIAKYVDPSRQARGPHEMAYRLTKATKQRVAISGVVGALKYYPELDVTSPPRLDLCIAPASGQEDLSFVHKLDAGLVRDDDASLPALTVHILSPRSDKQFFEIDGLLYADPLECLVALYDMKLYEQADEMLQHLIRQQATTVS